MLPELGHFALILTLFVALTQGGIALAGAARNNSAWIAFARPAARVQFLLILISFVALVWSFAVSDFSVAYVAHNSNSQLPWFYRLAATWGGHERSEEHTFELQSLMRNSYAVFCLKKKKIHKIK